MKLLHFSREGCHFLCLRGLWPPGCPGSPLFCDVSWVALDRKAHGIRSFVFLALENKGRNGCNKLSKMEPKLAHMDRIWEGFVCLLGVFLELCEHSYFYSPLEP